MDRKVKSGLTPAGIVAIVFTVLGGIYFFLGIGLSLQPADGEEYTASIVFAVLGGAFLAIALTLWIYTALQRKRLQAIVDSGKYIWGEITDIICNYQVQVNNRYPYYMVLVRYIDRHGAIHLFRSTSLKTYPDRSVIGKQVKIYYKDETYKHYYIDVEGVFPKVIEH